MPGQRHPPAAGGAAQQLNHTAHKCTVFHADVSRKVAHGAAITHGFLSSGRSGLRMVSSELAESLAFDF